MIALADDRHNGPDDLDARIARAKGGLRSGAARGAERSENRGWAIGIEFVGAVLVGAAIGWGFDRYAGLHTAPWGMIVMLALGFAAGTRRALQTSAEFDADSTNDKGN